MNLSRWINKNKLSEESAASEEEVISSYGDVYMPAKEFQVLAQRMASLRPKIDWLAIMGGIASGSLPRPVTPDSLKCILRPLKNKTAQGLVLESQVVAIPPDKIDFLKRTAEAITFPIGMLNGFAAEIVKAHPELPSVLWFRTIMFKGTGFSDDDLCELIDENFDLGNLAFHALRGVNVGDLSVAEGTRYFLSEYESYRYSRGKSVTSYE